MGDNLVEKLGNYKAIISAMGEQYLCAFAFDIEQGIAFDIKGDKDYKLSDSGLSLQQVLNSKIEKFTTLENVPEMKTFGELSSLDERLADKKVISNIFLGNDYRWCNSKFIRMGNEKPLRYVLCLIELVDDQVLFFEQLHKNLKENKKIHNMMNAFLEEYNTVCTVNLETKKVEFSQLSERLLGSYLEATKVGNADELAAMYIAMAIHENDRKELRKILTKEFIENNIEVDSSTTFTYRNELGNYFEMRIYRNSPTTVFFGFKDKTLEMENMYNKVYTDSLTGVKNRKYYDEQVDNQPCEAFIICDIDYFKSFNDTYGHQFGDYVISLVANALKHCLRSSDDVIRYGGDEFVITFKTFTIEALQTVLEKMRTTIEKATIDEHPEIHLSMSFGASFGSGTAHQMLSKADEALYKSKQTRNSVTIEIHEKGKTLSKALKNNE